MLELASPLPGSNYGILKMVRPSPFFFQLALNAFPDIGLVGQIEKKT